MTAWLGIRLSRLQTSGTLVLIFMSFLGVDRFGVNLEESGSLREVFLFWSELLGFSGLFWARVKFAECSSEFSERVEVIELASVDLSSFKLRSGN